MLHCAYIVGRCGIIWSKTGVQNLHLQDEAIVLNHPSCSCARSRKSRLCSTGYHAHSCRNYARIALSTPVQICRCRTRWVQQPALSCPPVCIPSHGFPLRAFHFGLLFPYTVYPPACLRACLAAWLLLCADAVRMSCVCGRDILAGVCERVLVRCSVSA